MLNPTALQINTQQKNDRLFILIYQLLVPIKLTSHSFFYVIKYSITLFQVAVLYFMIQFVSFF